MSATPWKGKKRDEGSGGNDGTVVNLKLVGDGVFFAVYTVDVAVGSGNRKYPLQVDTGSSDLWIASNSCSDQPCTNKVPQYDPSVSSRPTGESFSIQYLSGAVSGPIVWDRVVVGGYSIENQALAAATSVSNEPLSNGFAGILGLALPLNSVIAQEIPPVANDSPDGAAFTSNVLGITPVEDAPSQFFFSLSLARPGSNKIPSTLGIGRHPSSIVTDPSQITYSSLVADSLGTLFWKVEIIAITVYVNGVPNRVNIGRGVNGGIYPEAVLDSGVPFILATRTLASGIWGALGVSPAADGNFYVPCSKPLNMSITIAGQGEIPLHPLDLSAPPITDPGSPNCVGLIQQAGTLQTPNQVGDMILGVSFLRSVYSVMAYERVTTDGVVGNSTTTKRRRRRQLPLEKRVDIKPRLGLLKLTDPTTALNEFNAVRLLNQPLDQPAPSGGHGNIGPAPSGEKRISVGLEVLFGLLGFFALCCTMFCIRWLVVRKRWADNEKDFAATPAKDVPDEKIGKEVLSAYELAPRGSQAFSEDTEGTKRASDFKKSWYGYDPSIDTGRTRVASHADSVDLSEQELGLRPRLAGDAFGGEDGVRMNSWHSQLADMTLTNDGPAYPVPVHHRTLSEMATGSAPAVVTPLLQSHSRNSGSQPDIDDDLAEFGMGASAFAIGMAGVGTAFRGSLIDHALTSPPCRTDRRDSSASTGSFSSGSMGPTRPSGRPMVVPRPSSGLSAVVGNSDDGRDHVQSADRPPNAR